MRKGTQNCEAPASWNLRLVEDRRTWSGACDLHLGQVGDTLLRGEHGDLELRRNLIKE